MRKCFIVAAYWLFACLFFSPNVAWGYIDPATTTYIIQVSTAIVITIGVSLSIFVYRFQMIVTNIKVLIQMLVRRVSTRKGGSSTKDDQEEDGGRYLSEKEALEKGILACAIPAKEHYAAIAQSVSPAHDEPLTSATDALEDGESVQKSKGAAFAHWLLADERTKKERVSIALLLVSAVVMTYAIFNMIDSVITNRMELFFSFADIIGPILGFSLVMFLILFGLLFVLRGRAFDIMVCVGLAFLICGYLQSTFFNKGLGQLMGLQLTWEGLGVARVLLNLFMWVGVFALVFVLGLRQKKRVKKVFKQGLIFTSVLLIAVQAVALVSLIPQVQDWNPERRDDGMVEFLSREGLYEVSANDNIIVFIVDTMDSAYLDMLYDSDPHIYDFLDGFTRYRNNTSIYNMTFPSVPHLMTGVFLDVDKNHDEYLEYAYSHPVFIEDIRKQGYVCNLYLDKAYDYNEEEQIRRFSDNIAEGKDGVKVVKAPVQLFRLSLLRSAPLALKPNLWLYSDILGFESIGKDAGNPERYLINDPRFYRDLKSEGLTTVDDPHFIFIHLQGFHAPYTMDAQAQRVRRGVEPEEQFLGSLLILEEYLGQLKERGLYKDATIFIIADHAEHSMFQLPEDVLLAGCFVKPAGAEGSPLRESEAPVTIENLRAACVAAAGGDSSQWGKTYSEVDESALLERPYYHLYSNQDENGWYLAEFRIVGDPWDWNNWTYLGRESYVLHP